MEAATAQSSQNFVFGKSGDIVAEEVPNVERMSVNTSLPNGVNMREEEKRKVSEKNGNSIGKNKPGTNGGVSIGARWAGRLFGGDLSWENTVCIECDPTGKPYSEIDILKVIGKLVSPEKVTYIGTVGVRHVFSIGLRDQRSLDILVKTGEVLVKGKRAIISAVSKAKTVVQIKWIPPEVPNKILEEILSQYGVVEKIEHDKLKTPGFEHILTTSRTVVMELKPNTTVNDMPYLIRALGRRFAVVIRGRPPICFRCKQKGHTRERCSAPKCPICFKIGHTIADCNQSSYAARLKENCIDQVPEWEMEELEALHDNHMHPETVENVPVSSAFTSSDCIPCVTESLPGPRAMSPSPSCASIPILSTTTIAAPSSVCIRPLSPTPSCTDSTSSPPATPNHSWADFPPLESNPDSHTDSNVDIYQLRRSCRKKSSTNVPNSKKIRGHEKKPYEKNAEDDLKIHFPSLCDINKFSVLENEPLSQ